MIEYSTIEHALDELRAGRLIMCTDDPERENEGDLICAAQFATTENINFMATHAKGLICMPMNDEYIAKLALPQMVARNTDNHETAFTVSIDHVDTTTGISAAERSITAMKCVDPRRPAARFPPSGAHVPPARQSGRRARAQWTHRSDRRSVPPRWP